MKLPFATYDVFTTTRFKGNQLAIVTAVDASLTKEQQLSIAQEFDYSETVFILNSDDGAKKHDISIYTPYGELGFAGHPTIGTSFHLMHDNGSAANNKNNKSLTLKPPAGDIPATYDPANGYVRLAAPHELKLHDYYNCTHERIKGVIRGLDNATYGELSKETIPLFSIVKNFTFALVNLASLEDLSKVSGMGPGTVLTHRGDLGLTDSGLDSESNMICNYCYVITGRSDDGATTDIRCRMLFEGTREDAATGSAACCVSAYISLQKGKPGGRYKYNITQGVEMGRQSDIAVEVVMKPEAGAVSSSSSSGGEVVGPHGAVVDVIYLMGTAVKVMEGVIEV